MKKVFKLTAPLFANIWGGTKLKRYSKDENAERIGESWELSFVKGSESKTEDERLVSEVFLKEDYGKNAEKFQFFPVLTKFIDAKENLSVQVHPDDEYALKNEGQFGKTEMWYIVEAEEGAGIYLGLKRDATIDQIKNSISSGNLEDLLNFKEVKAGESYFIPSGTIHAIGGGVLIFEIQQNSTLTYRLYDYMRKDKDGNYRELHVEKALKVLNPGVYESAKYETPSEENCEIIGKCEYFTAKKYTVKDKANFYVDSDTFKGITVISGNGTLSFEDDNGKTEELKISKGESYFCPASKRKTVFTLSGDMTVITTEV